MTTTTNLIERLWASDAANELTNEAARALEAQAKQIEALESEWRPTPCQATLHACITYLVHGKADFSGLPDGLVNTLTTKIEALQVDAERYRWLRYEAQYCEEDSPVCVSNGNTQGHAQVILSEEELDAAIDAARKGNI